VELDLRMFSLRNIWQLAKIIALIQVFNGIIGFFAWVSYGYAVSMETIVLLSVGYTLLILVIKKAQENANVEPR
jgi:hypothetical protein